jgi:hypothetical protein
MDWQTLLTIAVIVAFVWLMMRGCGGMMGGGGCGMGGPREPHVRSRHGSRRNEGGSRNR